MSRVFPQKYIKNLIYYLVLIYAEIQVSPN